MAFEPEKFFIGVIDLFSIFVPGGTLVLIGNEWASCALRRPPLVLHDTQSWMVFLFLAYLLGHLAFLAGAVLDELYDPFRKCTYLGQVERLAKGKKLSHSWFRCAANWIFGDNADNALTQAVRLKTQALAHLSDLNSINTFQWCKARLSKDHHEGFAAVQRFEADSKFFRSFVIVLLALGIVFALQHDWRAATVCLILLPPTFWRYMDLRFKSTQQAYWQVITLDSLAEIKSAATASSQAGSADGEAARSAALTHAGGIVLKGKAGKAKYLLVQESKNRAQWVMPKGHIELGEDAAQTAVREVEEETRRWARVVGWLGDFHFDKDKKSSYVRVFKMEYVGVSRKGAPLGGRESRWFEAKKPAAVTLYEETQTLLDKLLKFRKP